MKHQYDAFISYRRKDGAAVAYWVRDRLQRFVLPSEVLAALSDEKKSLHARRPRIWIDKAYEKSSDDFLVNKIYPALDRSARLIVILTPSAFETIRGNTGHEEPNWLVREVEHFLGESSPKSRMKHIDVVLGPKATEKYFPGRLAETDRWDPIDLRAFTWRRSWGLSEKLDVGLAKLVAALYDVPEAELPALRQEERRRRNRLLVGIGATASTVVVLMAFLAIMAWWQRSLAIDREIAATTRTLAAQARRFEAGATRLSDMELAGALALESIQRARQMGHSVDADAWEAAQGAYAHLPAKNLLISQHDT